MRKFIAWIKRALNFLFTHKYKAPVQSKISEQKSSQHLLPEDLFKISKKKKQEVVHRIPPNYFTLPNRSIFRRGLGNVQEITEWDGEHFPGRWRTRLIYHD